MSNMLVSCSQGLGPNDIQESENSPDAIYDDAYLSRYDPPVRLTLAREVGDGLKGLIDDLPGETLEDNRWSRLYRDVLGIEIAYDWTARSEQYYKKLDIMLASGRLPDVVKVNGQQLRQLSNAGLIQELTSSYETYASPFTKEILTQEGAGALESGTINGKLMGIPETDASIEKALYLWIRTDWMEELKLSPPETMQDVLAISKAFTDRDPDGNGIKDTYGLAATQYLFDPVMGLTGFMAGYGAYPSIWLKDENGRLVYGGIQPEVKDALEALQILYRDGQLDSEFAIKSGGKVKQQIADGKIGMMYGEQWASFVAQGSRGAEPASDWQAYPIVSATEQPVYVPLKFNTNQFYAVRKDYAHPEAVVKLFNLHLEKNWGKTAEYEVYYNTSYPVWGLSPVTPFPAKKNLEAYRQIKEAHESGQEALLQDEARFIQKKMDLYAAGMEDSESGWGWEKTYGKTGAMSVLDSYEQNNQLLFDAFVGAPTEAMIEKQIILDNLRHDVFINIILGNPLEEFDRFVEEWMILGGAQITAEVNQWYEERGQDLQ
ncbi:extracellular solute-binding protein [Paenibacillus sp. CAU 1782]